MDDDAASLSAQQPLNLSSSQPAPTTTPKPGEDPVAAGNRPPESGFHQQTLPAWQPLITAGSVFPLFLVLALVFITMGSFLLWTNASIVELSIDYTRCKKTLVNSVECASEAELPSFYASYSVCNCQVNFTLLAPMPGLVYAYYALTNFHQNHRKYVKSRDSRQLSGRQWSDLDAECSPYRRDEATGDWIAPCGAVANSLFNDTFQLIRNLPNNSGQETVPWTKEGISWPAEVARKYGEVKAWNGTVKPPNWARSEWQRSPDGYAKDEELQVWLSVAALPAFRKLHRRILHKPNTSYVGGLPAGSYTLLVNYSYPVVAFGGSKSFVLSTAGFLGGKNAGLGGLSVAVGCLHLALCCLFAVMHVNARKSRETDPYYGVQPGDKLLLEAMTDGISPPKNDSDEEDDGEDGHRHSYVHGQAHT